MDNALRSATLEAERNILHVLSWTAATSESDWTQFSNLIFDRVGPEHFSTDEARKSFSWIRELRSLGQRPTSHAIVGANDPELTAQLLVDMHTQPLVCKEVVEHYLKHIHEHGSRAHRKALLLQAALSAEEGKTTDVNSHLEAYYKTNMRLQSTAPMRMTELAKKGIQDIKDEIDLTLSGKPPLGTGFVGLDNAFGNLRSGGMMVVGARTSSGKTAFCLSVGIKNSLLGTKVGLVSIEDNAHKLGQRAAAHSMEQTVQSIKDYMNQIVRSPGNGNQEMNNRMREVFAYRTRLEHFVVAHPASRQLHDIETSMRRLRAEFQCEIIMVDYVQAILLDKDIERQTQLIEIASRIKATGESLDVPVILTSQMRRSQVDPRTSKTQRPSMHELRGSGEIEEIAEWIMTLWRESDSRTMASIEKNKNGPVGKVFEVDWHNGHLSMNKFIEVVGHE